MLFPKTKKQRIVYVLASFLDRDNTYSEVELDRFIRDNVNSATLSVPRLSVDHLRVAMVESKYVLRTEDGRAYRLAPDYLEPYRPPDELVRQAGEFGDSGYVRCPYCHWIGKPRPLLLHLLKRHDPPEIWEEILAKYLG